MEVQLSRWLRVVRGVIGTGLTFAVGVGAAVSAIGAAMWVAGAATPVDILRSAGRFSVVAFLLGVVFSGALVITARARVFQRLSLWVGGALGAGAGVVYWVFLALTGGRVWTPRLAIGNLVVLVIMGVGAAMGTLLIARRGGAALRSADETERLGVGGEEFVGTRRESKVEVPRR